MKNYTGVKCAHCGHEQHYHGENGCTDCESEVTGLSFQQAYCICQPDIPKFHIEKVPCTCQEFKAECLRFPSDGRIVVGVDYAEIERSLLDRNTGHKLPTLDFIKAQSVIPERYLGLKPRIAETFMEENGYNGLASDWEKRIIEDNEED